MPSPHLLLHPSDHVFGAKTLGFFAEHDLKRQVEQQIAQLGADRVRIALTQGVVQLQRFLHQVRAERLRRLGAIPRAPFSEITDQQDSASKR